MSVNQRTIRNERSIKGKSLHTGDEVTLTLKPAKASSGYLFRRTDLYGKPEIQPLTSSVSELVRSTTISNGNAKVHTIEHVLSALSGCGIDNAIIEPIAKGYRALPVPIRTGTGNFVSNLRSLLTLSNNVLQGDLKGAGNTVGRFAINTTVGILGVFDPASKMGFEKRSREDLYIQ